MYTYSQSTGQLHHNSTLLTTGYSGRGVDKNIPADQGVVNLGPLPTGWYVVGQSRTDPKLGPLAMPLTPDSNNTMMGRGGFYIHGDSILHPGDASEGCIILDATARAYIANGSDKILQVVP